MVFKRNRQSVEECISEFKIGEPVCFKEFISTTNSEQLYNPDGEIQIFISNSKRGRNLSELNTKEAEVLYERSSAFRVINVINREGKYHVILEEA